MKNQLLQPFLWGLANIALSLLSLAGPAAAQEQPNGVLVLAPLPIHGVPKGTVRAASAKPPTYPIAKSKEAVRVELPPGTYAVHFDEMIIAPIPNIVIESGKETTLDLAAAVGTVRLTPMEKDEKFSWLEFLNDKGQRVAAYHPGDQSPFYGLATGRYSVRFDRTYATPVPFEIKAGQETDLKLAEAVGKLRLTPMEKAEKFSWLEFLDDKGQRVAAYHPGDQSPFYGLATGRYSVRFDRTYATPVPFEIKAGQETDLKLAEAVGKLRLTPMEKAEKFSWLEFLNDKGQRVAAYHPGDQSPFYGLATGRYSVRFDRTYATPVPFEIKAGRETDLKLAEAVGKLRLTPMEKAEKFSWLEFLDDKGQRVAAYHPGDQSPFYGLAPGHYRVRFEYTYLAPIPFTAFAGKETPLDLQKLLGRLEIDRIGASNRDQFDLFDLASGVRVASLDEPRRLYHGVLPGQYRMRLPGRDLPEVRVTMAAGKTTRVTPGKTEAAPADFKEELLPVRVQEGDTTVELSWDAPKEKEVAGYRLFRLGSERPIHGARLLTKPKFQDIGLINGQTYHYIVRAVLSNGTELQEHGQASATPKLEKPGKD